MDRIDSDVTKFWRIRIKGKLALFRCPRCVCFADGLDCAYGDDFSVLACHCNSEGARQGSLRGLHIYSVSSRDELNAGSEVLLAQILDCARRYLIAISTGLSRFHSMISLAGFAVIRNPRAACSRRLFVLTQLFPFLVAVQHLTLIVPVLPASSTGARASDRVTR